MEERFKTFTVLISKINRNIKRIKTEEMREYDLKSPHVSCLYYIHKMGDITATNLCDICGEDKAAISRTIEQLEEKGYVSRATSEKKRYNSYLSLTDSGKVIAEKIAEKIDKIVDLASISLDEHTRLSMYKALMLISDNLEEYCKKYEGDK